MSKKFLTPKRLAQFCTALIWAGAIFSLLTRSYGKQSLWIGIGISLAGLILRMVIVRCPTCGHRLTDMQSMPERCPHCGEKLD